MTNTVNHKLLVAVTTGRDVHKCQTYIWEKDREESKYLRPNSGFSVVNRSRCVLTCDLNTNESGGHFWAPKLDFYLDSLGKREIISWAEQNAFSTQLKSKMFSLLKLSFNNQCLACHTPSPTLFFFFGTNSTVVLTRRRFFKHFFFLLSNYLVIQNLSAFTHRLSPWFFFFHHLVNKFGEHHFFFLTSSSLKDKNMHKKTKVHFWCPNESFTVFGTFCTCSYSTPKEKIKRKQNIMYTHLFTDK